MVQLLYKHLDYCTHMQFPEDKDILTRKLFDVNMRLFHSNDSYRKLIIDICNYIIWCCATEKEGYTKPRGYSGANAGIPFNIIGYDLGDHLTKILINPKITHHSDEIVTKESNCGSLTLAKTLKVPRWKWITVEYFKMNGKKYTQTYTIEEKSGTIQHEIEHNLGILITDLTGPVKDSK